MLNINVKTIDLKLAEIKDKIDVLTDFVEKKKYIDLMNNLEQESRNPNLWDNPNSATTILKELKHKKDFVNRLAKYKSDYEGCVELFNDLKDDPEFIKSVDTLESDTENMYFSTLFHDPHDDSGCFVTITAGSGGSEAQDWANMLFGMYYNFGKQEPGFKVKVLEYSDTDVGLKSGTLEIEGEPGSFPYGLLKGENGIHRLVRPSPFNANNNRHTSFASVLVTPAIEDNIEVNISESSLRIDTYRSSGAGGQHVNKTDSAVRITHIPTGIVVQCQNDRSQHRNKAEAMKILRSRLYAFEEQKQKSSNQVQKDAISWGNQIRSYVLDDSRIKDLRTGFESFNPTKVLSGDIRDFLNEYVNMVK